MLNLIAIDASTEACSVALSFNDVIYSEFELCPQSHSLVLLPMIDGILKQANCQLTDLDGIVFGQGPGSFTGVRIGVGVVQGLAFSANLKVAGISTLRAMAQQAFDDHQQSSVIAAIDARMSEVYAGFYQVDENGIMNNALPDIVIPPAQLTESLAAHCQQAYGVGTGWDAYSEELSELKTNQETPDILFPNAKSMLKIGQHMFEQGLVVCAEQAQPVYVRDTVSWKKLPGRE